MRTIVSFVTVVVISIVTLIFGADGATPIWEPTTITSAGSYVLTRDIEIAGGSAIDVDADDVTLDLNGFTVTSTSSTLAVIRLFQDRDNFLLRNGTVRGGGVGVYFSGLDHTSRIRIEELTISGQDDEAVAISDARYIEIKRCRLGPTVTGTGIKITTNDFFGFEARIVDNYVRNPGSMGIWLAGARSSEIARNIITREEENGHGIRLEACHGTRILDNFVSADSLATYEAYHLTCNDSIISGNVARRSGNDGFEVGGGGNRIVANEATRSLAHGIRNNGTNYLSENTCYGNSGFGLYFDNGSGVYRDNILRGNTLGAVGGAAATDAGGNIN